MRGSYRCNDEPWQGVCPQLPPETEVECEKLHRIGASRGTECIEYSLVEQMFH